MVVAVLAACVIAVQFPAVNEIFFLVRVPVVTFLVVGLLCLFNVVIMKTRLGQQFRAVGQNRVVANAAGINVDKTRIIAIIFSTVLAGLGHLIFAQNLGSLQTYGAHEQVGLYAGAAILVGGASIVKASNGQALLGALLFHLLFIVVSGAGRTVFGDAAIGEYFRVFISYGVIAVALVMHAWSAVGQAQGPGGAAARRVRKGVNTHSSALFRAFRGRGLFPRLTPFRVVLQGPFCGPPRRFAVVSRVVRGGFSALCRTAHSRFSRKRAFSPLPALV